MEARGVQADGVGQVVLAGDLGHEGLPRRVVEGHAEAEEQREQVDVLGSGDAGDSKQPEGHGTQRQPQLGDLENAALVEPVGDQTAVRAEQQHGQELQARGNADGKSRPAGQLQNQPVLGHPLHPGADVGDEGAGEIDPVVTTAQRGEHAAAARRSLD
jgi:hypothetical protein